MPGRPRSPSRRPSRTRTCPDGRPPSAGRPPSNRRDGTRTARPSARRSGWPPHRERAPRRPERRPLRAQRPRWLRCRPCPSRRPRRCEGSFRGWHGRIRPACPQTPEPARCDRRSSRRGPCSTQAPPSRRPHSRYMPNVRLHRMGRAASLALALLRLVQRAQQQRQKHQVVRQRQATVLPASLADRATQPAVRSMVAFALGFVQALQTGHHVSEHPQRTSFPEKALSAWKPSRIASNVSCGSAENALP